MTEQTPMAILDDIQEGWDSKFLQDLLRGTTLGEVLPDLLAELCRHRSSPSTAAGGSDLQAKISALEGELADERMEHGLLRELLSRPEIDEFCEGVMLEAAHQRQRWGDAHDREKSAENWYWLVGYLAGKALRSAIEGNQDKARHHTISAAAALFQWHKSIKDHVNGIGRDTDLAVLDAAPAPLPESPK